jgi:hypothetical protein
MERLKMNIPSWISRIINKPVTERTYLWLDEKQGGRLRKPLKPGTCYISVRIKAARIPLLRHVTTRYHLSVVSWLEYRTTAAGLQKGTAVLSPGDLMNLTDGPGKGPGDRIVFIDKPILRQIPWAGELQLKTALFAVVDSDLAKPVLNYLVDATQTLGLGFAGPAKIYADLVNKASDAIFGTPGSTILQVGLDRTFGAEDLTSGYLFVSDAPSGTFDPAKLTFEPGSNKIHLAGEPYSGDSAYMLLEIADSSQRYDWGDFAELRAAWDKVHEEYNRDPKYDPELVEMALDRYARLLRSSPDFLIADAERVAQDARDKYEIRKDMAKGNYLKTGRKMDLPKFEDLYPVINNAF